MNLVDLCPSGLVRQSTDATGANQVSFAGARASSKASCRRSSALPISRACSISTFSWYWQSASEIVQMQQEMPRHNSIRVSQFHPWRCETILQRCPTSRFRSLHSSSQNISESHPKRHALQNCFVRILAKPYRTLNGNLIGVPRLLVGEAYW